MTLLYFIGSRLPTTIELNNTKYAKSKIGLNKPRDETFNSKIELK